MRALLILVAVPLLAQQLALPGYRFSFPRDHFNHPAFDTEWWYYTGNLATPQGRRFGFELTFFRQAVDRTAGKVDTPWRLDHLYMAHLALTDVAAGTFRSEERLSRSGPGLAGCDLATRRIWNGNWKVRLRDDRHTLQAVADGFTLHLDLTPLKPPVIHGLNGISRKSAGAGQASHYISFTRLAAEGTLERNGERLPLSGTAWMDHEFFTHPLEVDQTGWDWFSVQLETGEDLMLYRLRRRDGTVEPYSSGTFVDRDGQVRHLELRDFTLTPGRAWEGRTGARYPVAWTLRVPSLALDLSVTTPVPQQELVSDRRIGPNYWEGLVDYAGQREGKPIRGVGYLEMTGYDPKARAGGKTPATR